jgi:membrane-bound lytic murein transglycosylase D
MQLITSVSKFVGLAVLSCTLLLVWDGGSYIEVPAGYADIEESSSAKSVSEESSNAKPVDDIWSSISRELTLDHRAQSSQVQAEIRKLLADQGKLYNILKAAGPYIYFIHKQTQARGLPAEIALIPVIESEFNPYDKSKKGATGLWQLMRGTAQELGVKVKSGYDGRRNVIASTKAALAYFNDLGNNFNGNWYLAIAAYNCGQGRIESAVRRRGSKSFWNLSLPKETKYYVPKLLAVAAIVKNPEKYGVQLPVVVNKPYFKEIKVHKTVNLEQVAKSSGVSIKTLHTLNPDLNRKTTVVLKNGSGTLLVPIDKMPAVKAQHSTQV